MIKNIHSSSKYLTVQQTHGNPINPYPTLPSTGAVGMMRWNPTSGTIEVWDNTSWISITATAEVNLSPHTEDLLDWAMKQKTRMERLERLATENVTIRDALENYTRAEEALRIFEALCEKTESDAA